MGPFGIVEAVDVAAEGSAGFGDIVIGSQIDLPLLDCAPEPFNEDIVPPSRLPSMLMAISYFRSRLVKSMLVN